MAWLVVLASVGILFGYAFGSSSIDDTFMDYGTFYRRRDSEGKDVANIQISDAVHRVTLNALGSQNANV